MHIGGNDLNRVMIASADRTFVIRRRCTTFCEDKTAGADIPTRFFTAATDVCVVPTNLRMQLTYGQWQQVTTVTVTYPCTRNTARAHCILEADFPLLVTWSVCSPCCCGAYQASLKRPVQTRLTGWLVANRYASGNGWCLKTPIHTNPAAPDE